MFSKLRWFVVGLQSLGSHDFIEAPAGVSLLKGALRVDIGILS